MYIQSAISGYLKESHWYRMKASSHERLIPQTEEEISELRWLAPGNFNIVLANTYPSIVEVLWPEAFLVWEYGVWEYGS